MQICKMSVKKTDLLNAINAIKGHVSAKGDEYISFDFKIGCASDEKLNDCIMEVAKKKGEYDKPSIVISKFRTLENYKIFMKQMMDYRNNVKSVMAQPSQSNNNSNNANDIDF